MLAFGGLALLVALGGCEPAQSSDNEGSGMIFGLFKGKAAKPGTVVHPDVGATLKRETAYPAAARDALAKPANGFAVPTQIDGTPPSARFVDQRVEGETTTAYRVAASGTQPPITLVNLVVKGIPTSEIWEMDPAHPERFAKRRLTEFDPAQSKWVGYSANGATLLPAGQLLVGMYYVAPPAKVGFYVYDIAANAIRPLGVVQPDWSKGVPFVYADTIQLTPDTAIVLYHTDKLLLGSERYANEHDHVMLVSPRYPHGIEILNLSLDDGNVQRWGMVGHTLWMETLDARPRDGARFVWSLDLSRMF